MPHEYPTRIAASLIPDLPAAIRRAGDHKSKMEEF